MLELERPIHGVAPPLNKDSINNAESSAFILGVFFDGGCRFGLDQITVDWSRGLRSDGVKVGVNHAFGAQGGFSGGPVFQEVDGEPRFCGLARLGGDGIAVGALIARDIIHQFLSPHIKTPQDATTHPEGRRCLLRGHKPEAKLQSGLPDVSLPTFSCVLQDGGNPAAFISKTPLAAEAADVVRGKRPPAVARLLPAHIQSARDVEMIIGKLKQASEIVIRLPTPAEWSAFYETYKRETSPVRTTGRPPALEDFVTAEGLPRRAPAGVLEWLQDTSGPALFVTGSGLPERAVAARLQQPQSHERAVLRLAFTSGWGHE